MRPNRSASQPTTGDSAYMPKTWTLMTSPTMFRVAPSCRMCTGVITITDTITVWLSAIAASPSVAARDLLTARIASRSEAWWVRAAGSIPSRLLASSSGSGRSPTIRISAAAANAATEKRTGPASGGRPTARARSPPGPVRLGPSTTPTVVAHTTVANARARVLAVARSVAAYRACRLVAVPLPNRVEPSITRRNDPTALPVMTTHAPIVATTYPANSPGRRPRADITRAIGNAATAPPSTAAVCDRPESAVEPETSSAIRPLTAMPLPTPMPPRTWVIESSRTTRRWTRSTPVAAPTASVVMPGSVGAATRIGHRFAAGTSMASHTARQTSLADSPASRACSGVRLPSSEKTCSSAIDWACPSNASPIRRQNSVSRMSPVSPVPRAPPTDS